MRKIGIFLLSIGLLPLISIIRKGGNAPTSDIITFSLLLFIGAMLACIGALRKKRITSQGGTYKEISWLKAGCGTFSYFIVVVAIIGILQTYIHVYDNSLEAQVEKFNKQLPRNIDGLGWAYKIQIEGNNVVTYIAFNESIGEMIDLEEINEGNFIISANLTTRDNKFWKSLVQQIIDRKYGIIIDYSPLSNVRKHTRLVISPKQLADWTKFVEEKPQEAATLWVKRFIASNKAYLPMEVEPGMQLVDLFLENNRVIFKNIVDESEFAMSMSEIEESKDNFREGIGEVWNEDPTTKKLLAICREGNISVVWRMVGDTSGETCDVTIY